MKGYGLMGDEITLSEAVKQGEWDKAKHLLAIRVSEMIEQTDSPRETKALAISLESLIKACEYSDVAHEETEIDRILADIKRVNG